jgi:hypothetical protein
LNYFNLGFSLISHSSETLKHSNLGIFAGGHQPSKYRKPAAGHPGQNRTLPAPTELVIYGKPKRGSPLTARQQTVGIDLPLKRLG